MHFNFTYEMIKQIVLLFEHKFTILQAFACGKELLYSRRKASAFLMVNKQIVYFQSWTFPRAKFLSELCEMNELPKRGHHSIYSIGTFNVF